MRAFLHRSVVSRVIAGAFLIAVAGSASAQTGSISGTVTDAATSAGIGAVGVRVFDVNGGFVAATSTSVLPGSVGTYTLPGLTPGPAYFVRTFNSIGYIDQRYGDPVNVRCFGGPCEGSGSPVVVLSGVTTPNINFPLARGGRFTGTMKDDQPTQAPLNGQVLVFDSAGANITSVFTSAGSYTTAALPSGTYYLRTFVVGDYINERYDGERCDPSCTVVAGAGLAITPPNDITVTFALTPARPIAGTVTDAFTGFGIGAGVTVHVFDSQGTEVTNLPTSGNGSYSTIKLPFATYHLATSNTIGGANEVFDNIACGAVCDPSAGTAVVISSGSPATANFGLLGERRIHGIVTSAATMAGLGNVTIQVLNASGAVVTTTTTSNVAASIGRYRTNPLTPGQYFIRTLNSPGHIDQVYGGEQCAPTCQATNGTPIAIVAFQAVENINLALTPGNVITGTVSAATGPLAGVTVSAVNSSNVTVRSAVTNASGAYTISGLLSGSYVLRTTNSIGYIDEAYDDVVCLACNAATALGTTPVVFSAPGETATDKHFVLVRGGQVTGRVTNAATGAGLGGITVQIFDSAGRIVGNATTSSAAGTLGNYATSGFPAGTYFARSLALTGELYIPELYDNTHCTPCVVTDGNPIPLTLNATTPNINFALDAGGRITGIVRDIVTLAPLSGVAVEFFNGAGVNTGTTAATNAAGQYFTVGLAPGTYFARSRIFAATSPSVGYASKVYDDVMCSGCNPLIGAPIPVIVGQTTADVDFLLEKGPRLSGHVQAADTSSAIPGVSVFVYGTSGLPASTPVTDANGNYITLEGLSPDGGPYYARTTNGLGYLNELYSNGPCDPTCTPTSGTAIPLTTAIVSGIDFSLERGGRVSGIVTDATGAPLNAVGIVVTDENGKQAAAALTLPTGRFITGGLANGNYFVRTENSAGYVNKVHRLPEAAECLGCDPAASGTAVAVSVGITTAIDFSLAVGGRIAGTVTDADLTPLRGVTVEVYADASGKPAAVGTTNQAGQFLTRSGVPTGATYKARTLNALGYINERFSDRPCVTDCLPAAGDPISVTAGATTAPIDFTLAADADLDGDGISSSIDLSSNASNDFSDVPHGGTTSGVVLDRSGWALKLSDVAPGGLVVGISGAGGEAKLQTCLLNAAEEVWLSEAGDTVSLECDPVTGSTTVRVIVAASFVELRKTIGDLTTIALLRSGQTATIGSPAVADPGNLAPVLIRVVDHAGTQIATYSLDPGESAEVVESSDGVLSVTVFSGTVTVEAGTEPPITLGVGQTYAFVLCAPLQIETLTANPAVLWPPNHKMIMVRLSPTLSGTCGTATFVITSVTSNEPINGQGDGDTAPDWEIGAGLTLQLRAERGGPEPARVYTVDIRGTDEAGNAVVKTVTISVPKIQ